MRACLAVLHRAAIEARTLGYEGTETGLSPRRSAQLADLMDAIHNIPELLARWEQCDETLLVGMLRDYDQRWSPLANLAEVYTNLRPEDAG